MRFHLDEENFDPVVGKTTTFNDNIFIDYFFI
jgi:hypothetical protein